ncbi:MAG: hypothetical protein ACUBOA_14315 [Candidatus Loosdrechtia sp.]|uniref:hypothetical protein n=1 Tax=Candidatus Loosdrechtia sp. TaxID=3101272 RepID=UPI003A63B2AD|nr:MAG: hypothetical protein QY305_04110 [Candidatus Jettenia sp. AMX2]
MNVLRIVFLFSVIIAMATLVVWEKNKSIELGYQIACFQKTYAELTEKNRKINYHVRRLKSPEIIAYKVYALRLPLILEDDQPGRLVASKTEGSRIKGKRAGLMKDLYTQKSSLLNCCSLHN